MTYLPERLLVSAYSRTWRVKGNQDEAQRIIEEILKSNGFSVDETGFSIRRRTYRILRYFDGGSCLITLNVKDFDDGILDMVHHVYGVRRKNEGFASSLILF